jgi:hypothetical protein
MRHCSISGDAKIEPQAVIVLLIVISLPIAWFASEFDQRRSLRIALGSAAIASAIGVAYLVGYLSRLSYNAWYGGASKGLVETTITQIEDGNIDRVMSVLRRLNLDYQRHELTLKNKYEATHVWHDLSNNTIWKTDTLHKLRRATPEQRAFTQQTE